MTLQLLDTSEAVLLDALVRASWQGAVALGFASLICRTFKRMPAALKCWIWRLGYLKLLLALVWATPITLRVLTPARQSALPESAPVGLAPTTDVGNFAQTTVNAASTNPPPVHRIVSQTHPDWRALLLLCWACGGLCAIVALSRRGLAAWRVRQGCSLISDPAVLQSYASVADRLNIRRPPLLLASPSIPGPLLLCALRPAIVLPTRARTTPADLRMMLAHELAHFRRGDILWSWLPSLARIVFWFHPLLWLAERQWVLWQESACDQTALAVTHSPPADYGRMLIDLLRWRRAARSRVAALAAAQSPGILQRRLLAMKTIHAWSARQWAWATVCLAVCGTMGIIPWRLAAQPAAASSAGPTSQPIAAGKEMPPPMDPGDVQAYIRATGDGRFLAAIVTSDIAHLQARPGSVIRQVLCKEGERVEKGQLLFHLDDAAQEAQVLADEFQLKNEMREQARRKKLLTDHAIDPAELEQVDLTVRMDEVKLRRSQAALNETRITSPITGIVSTCSAEVGQIVSSEVLATIVDPTNLKVRFDAPADAYPLMPVGTMIRCFAHGTDRSFNVRITYLSPEVDPQSQFMTVKGAVVGSPAELRSGLGITVDLPELRSRGQKAE